MVHVFYYLSVIQNWFNKREFIIISKLKDIKPEVDNVS